MKCFMPMMTSIAMAGQVLGVTVGVLQESPEIARRRRARADNQTKLAASREKHLKLAVKFALGGAEAIGKKKTRCAWSSSGKTGNCAVPFT